jgi:hypothetical protein
MAAQSPLIVASYTANTWASATPPGPDTVVVLTYSDGRSTIFNGRPRFRERLGASRVDVVDVSDRSSYTQGRLPAFGDIYHFQAEIGVSWRVADAAEVIRRRVVDGEPLVLGFLEDVYRPISRRYRAEDVSAAEDALRRALPPSATVTGGLQILGCSVHLYMDTRLASRVTGKDDMLHAGDLDSIESQRIRQRALALRDLVDGPQGAILVHLAQHPQDTDGVLELMMKSRSQDQQNHLALLDRLLERGFIQDADVGPLRDRLLGVPFGGWGADPVTAAPSPVPLPSARASWPAPGSSSASTSASPVGSWPQADPTTPMAAPGPGAAEAPRSAQPSAPQPEDGVVLSYPVEQEDGAAPSNDGVIGWNSVVRRRP